MSALVDRRNGLRAVIAILSATLAATLWFGSGARADDGHTIIGASQGGRLLVVYHIGTGPVPVFVMGAQHGGPEANTARLVNQLYFHFEANRGEIPSQIRLDLMPEANPDGLVSGSRLYQSGVDPNRNWAGPDWQTDAWDSNGVFRLGLGGSEPFSEIETRAVRDYLLATRPAMVVNYHSRGGFMFGGREGQTGILASAYATASGYPRPQPSAGGGSVLGYRASGTMNGWLGREGISGILIELTNFEDPEFARNLAGLKAVLQTAAAAAEELR
jgi:hypothetical protein